MVQELLSQVDPVGSAITLSWPAVTAIIAVTSAVWTAGFKYLQLSTLHAVDSSIKDLTTKFMSREVLGEKFLHLEGRLEQLTVAVEKQSSPDVIDKLQKLVVELGMLKVDLEHKLSA